MSVTSIVTLLVNINKDKYREKKGNKDTDIVK